MVVWLGGRVYLGDVLTTGRREREKTNLNRKPYLGEGTRLAFVELLRSRSMEKASECESGGKKKLSNEKKTRICSGIPL